MRTLTVGFLSPEVQETQAISIDQNSGPHSSRIY